jgi:hypothetical protein
VTLEGIGRDLRLAWRTLLRTPGLTLITIASLAVGFALTASTMAVVR